MVVALSELWWAEAVIPVERQADWAAAHEYIDRIEAQTIRRACPDAVNDLSEEELLAGGLIRPADGFDADAVLEYLRLVELLKPRLHRALDEIRSLMESKTRHLVCNFVAGGMAVYVHCSGFSCGDPDELCQVWMWLDDLGVLGAAGFLPTTPGIAP